MSDEPLRPPLRKPRRRPTPSNWASWKPFGLGEQRPNNYREVFRAIRENGDRAGYAWRILSQGVCDGCALGTKGLHDWTIEGIHLCNIRLRLLRMNTIGELDPAVLADVGALRELSGAELRGLGRIPFPLVRRRGEPGFTRTSWDEALELCAEPLMEGADRSAFYLTSRGMPNETYYAVQKAVRAIGTNSIDNAARVCHSPSTVALKEAIGEAASTCSYSDWIGTDLIVFIGSNVANNQPVTTKYLHLAKKAGTKVAVVNPHREPGMDRYWVPSNVESALFGTKICDEFFAINTGGDAAFMAGALRALVEEGGVDAGFVAASTEGFDEAAAAAGASTWEELELVAGATRERMREFARMLAEADRGVLVWSMGVTQHEGGEDNVRSIVNLGLARGWIGREGCGLMPIRGHSGVQGGAEMGCYATAFPGGTSVNPASAGVLSSEWGFDVPDTPGLTAPEMIDAAGEGWLDLLFSAGGNFLEVLPDPAAVAAALARVPVRAHMDLCLSSQMLIEPGEGSTILVLPAMTRYEIPGGVTETTTERRIVLSPEIPGPRVAEARTEWQALGELATRVRPDLADNLTFADTGEIRREIAMMVPDYRGIENLREGGESFQYGGPHLCAGGRFRTADEKAHFSAVEIAAGPPADGRFALSTRRGKQFNSMVQEDRDRLTGAVREALLLNPDDAERLGLAQGDAVLARNEHGELRCRAHLAPIAPGNVQVHWPEGNVLLGGGRRSPGAGIPDYTARVTLQTVPAETRTRAP